MVIASALANVQLQSTTATCWPVRLRSNTGGVSDCKTVLPCAEAAAMLFWALLASGQIRMRKIDGWQSLATPVCVSACDFDPVECAL